MIGPCLAGSSKSGSTLLRAMLNECHGQDVFVDVPESNRLAFARTAQGQLEAVRGFVRMVRGPDVRESLMDLFASSGPEMG